ncbi:hypothetical protein N7457_009114 [Penicillium paradoxum]|uniref:uncharacterized protein n=1 Tax=Penicillium paradoxum TaxID=176176 RepID=UPI002546FEEF|nr:uncharacterized protein N7457_009114 [Penicillium paradoxum]KAJ5774218.1 hypothetical protein N7457_009114 [Penicillium paradoxum]
MAPYPKEFDHLDAAVNRLTSLLNKEKVRHIFIGGYATCLLGGARVTEDVDLITEKECRKYLLESGDFTVSTDNRLAFRYRDKVVHIDILITGRWRDTSCDVPLPRKLNTYLVAPRDCPERRLHDHVPIMHPSALVLSKLKPWGLADRATRMEFHMRCRTDLMDIKTILQWLVENGMEVQYSLVSEIPKQDLLPLLSRLYRKEPTLRGLMAEAFSPDDLLDVLKYQSKRCT